MKTFDMPLNAADVCRNALAREQDLETPEMVSHGDISAALLGYGLALRYVNEQLNPSTTDMRSLKEKIHAIRQEYGQFFDDGGIVLIRSLRDE